MGGAVVRSWQLVDLPFQPEYPGGRQWNMDAAQLIYQLAVLDDEESPKHPNWDKVLNHIGNDLNAAVREAPWRRRPASEPAASISWPGSPA